MNKDIINLVKDSASTFLNIAEMTQYRMRYVQDRDAEAKEKMYKHAFIAGVGILSRLTMGVLGLLKTGHDEIQKTECYDNNGCPSYIR